MMVDQRAASILTSAQGLISLFYAAFHWEWTVHTKGLLNVPDHDQGLQLQTEQSVCDPFSFQINWSHRDLVCYESDEFNLNPLKSGLESKDSIISMVSNTESISPHFLEFWLIGSCVMLGTIQAIQMGIAHCVSTSTGNVINNENHHQQNRHQTTRKEKIWRHFTSLILIVWTYLSWTHLLSECDSCFEINDQHYWFCYWCCYMMATTLLYHFVPESAAVMIIVLFITMIPALLILNIIGYGDTVRYLSLCPDEWFGYDVFDDEDIMEEEVALNPPREERVRDERRVFDDVNARLSGLRITLARPGPRPNLSISRLPVLKASQTNAIKNEEECPICLASYEEEDKILLLPCMHRFHVDCVDSWIYKANRCPLCRTPVLPLSSAR